MTAQRSRLLYRTPTTPDPRPGLDLSGLVAEYRFNETSGQTLINYANSGSLNGTLGSTTGSDTNDPAWVADFLRFNGSTGYVNIGQRWMSNVDNFALEAYVRAGSLTQTGMIIYNGDDATGVNNGIASAAGYGIAVSNFDGASNNNYLVALVGAVGWVSSGWRFPNTTDFFHVIFTRVSGTHYFYVNGVQYTTGSSITPNQPDNQARIGHEFGSGSRYFNGDIRHVIVRNVAVTQAMATADYAYVQGLYNTKARSARYDSLVVNSDQASVPFIQRSTYSVMPFQDASSKCGFVIGRGGLYVGFRIQPSLTADMSQVLAHIVPALWDADANTTWNGHQTGAWSVARDGLLGQARTSVSAPTGATWAQLTMTAGSYDDTQLLIQCQITNLDTSTHNVRLALLGYGRAQNTTAYAYDAPTTTAAFSTENGSGTSQYMALKLLTHAPNTYAVGRTAISFSSGTLDNTATFTPTATTNYYNGLATSTISIPAGQSVTITAVLSMSTSISLARTKASNVASSTSLSLVRDQWITRMAQTPDPPRLVSEATKQAWYFAYGCLYAGERWNQTPQTLLYASAENYRDTWYWDSVLGSMGATLAPGMTVDRAVIEHLLDTRMNQSTGFISHIPSSSVSQPPFIGRLAYEFYTRKVVPSGWLATYYPKLKLHYQWWLSNRKHATLKLFTVSQADESGMDNSPIFDTTIPEAIVQLTSILYDYARCMEYLAAINTPADVSYWQGEYAAILTDAQNMWNGTDGWFYPLSSGTTQRTIKAADAFFAIWSGLATLSQAQAMSSVISSLFLGTYGTRSVASNEATYNASLYWRGPSWTNCNSLLAWGLHSNYGLSALAQEIIAREIANCQSFGDFIEMINVETGAAGTNAGGYLAAPHNVMHAGTLIRAINALYG